MELHVDVDEADVGKVREGQTATFTVDAYPGRKFESRLVSLHNVAKTEANVVTYEAVLSVDNSDLSLRPGMTATAEVVAEKIGNVLLVPNAALRFTPPEMVTRTQSGPPSLIPGIGQRPQGSPARNSRGARNANQGTVWVLREGKPVAVPVTKGASDGQDTAVRSSDLKAGDEVLVDLVEDPAAKEAK
jgi:HlyD family secretion protein